MTPEEALKQFQQVTGLRVFAVLDQDGTAWWAKPDTETPAFECTIGDRFLHIDELTTDLTPDMEPHTGLSADLRRACAAIGGKSPIMSSLANLLGAIADDMDEAPAYQRKAFAGTAAEHLQIWDNDGVRIDWTEALELARTILGEAPGADYRAKCVGGAR